jgi:membrane-associated phospholipid phosphatase
MGLLIAGAALFAACAIVAHGGAPAWDDRLYLALNDVPSALDSVLTPLAHVLSPLGLPIAIVVAAVYVTTRNRSVMPVAVGATAGGAAWLLSTLAKEVADRPRPYEVIADAVLRQQAAHGTSFPSTHTAVAVATALALLPFLPRRVATVAIVYAVLVGWSRIYLGVHYPLDVLAGAGVGMAVGGLVLIGVRAAATRRPSPPGKRAPQR